MSMKLRQAAACALVVWYSFGSPLVLWAQSDTKLFTDPEGAFSFHYSTKLVRCEKSSHGNYVWDPPQNCAAYIPTCDDLVGMRYRQTSKACFAYPRNKFTDTPAFEAATFSVEIIDHNVTRKTCWTGDADEDKSGTTMIDHVSFVVFELRQGAMNQFMEVHVYRTFRNGQCYQLGINVATANATVFEPPPVRTLSEAAWHEVNRTLEQALNSFRFLK
jgi:hypothetical protein